MLMQHTYSGLIDEIYGNEYAMLDVLATDMQHICQEKELKLPDLCFNSADPVWEELRDVPFIMVADVLKRKIHESNADSTKLSRDLEARKNEGHISLEELAAAKEEMEAQGFRIPMLAAHQMVINRMTSYLNDKRPKTGQGGVADCEYMKKRVGKIETSPMELILLETIMHPEGPTPL
jgi:hypothetical protein